MRILTKRNLLLGNVVLGLIFALVAYSAARPILWPRRVSASLEEISQQSTADVTLEAEKQHHADMLREYPLVIGANDIFVAKVPKPKVEAPVVKPPPLKEPRWVLAGTWEPEPGVFEATIIDNEKRPPKELVARKGTEFLEYQVVITEVTADYVRYEIRDDKYNRVVERFLPPSAARLAGPLPKEQKDWSEIIEELRTNYYAVNLTRFEAECEKLAGEDGDWVDMLINTVEAEPYKPGGEDAPLQGYKVLSFKAESPLDELGVEPQDVIVGLVNKPITDAAQGRELLREALSQDEVRLNISRLGRPVFITVRLVRF
jgi:hypothetical protein